MDNGIRNITQWNSHFKNRKIKTIKFLIKSRTNKKVSLSKESITNKKVTFNNFEGREYDYDKLEAGLLGYEEVSIGDVIK